MIKSDVGLEYFCPCIRNNHNHTLVLVLHRNWTSLLFRPSIALHTVVSVHTYHYIRYTLIRSFIFHICQGSYRMNILLYIEPRLNYGTYLFKSTVGMLKEYPYNSYQSLLYSKCCSHLFTSVHICSHLSLHQIYLDQIIHFSYLSRVIPNERFVVYWTKIELRTVHTYSKPPLGMLSEYPYNSYQSLLYGKCNCKTLESIRGKMINPCQYYLTV